MRRMASSKRSRQRGKKPVACGFIANLKERLRSFQKFFAEKFNFSKKGLVGRFSIVGLILAILFSNLIFFSRPEAVFSQTYSLVQNDWSGGTSSGTVNAPSNLTAWDEYASASGLTAGAGSLALTGGNTVFNETFTGTAYRDRANTTAVWDGASGEISAGSYVENNLSAAIAAAGLSGYVSSIAVDQANRIVYFGDLDGELGMYDLVSHKVTNLTTSSGLSAFWGTNYVTDMVLDGTKLYMISASWEFGVYDTSTGVATDIWDDAIVGQPNSLTVDTDTHVVYIGCAYGIFSSYDPSGPSYAEITATSGLSAFWGTGYYDAISGLTYNGSGKVYLVSQDKDFAYLDTGTGTVTDLSSLVSSISPYLYSVAYNSGNGKLYMVGGTPGSFFSYTPGSPGTMTDLTSVISGVVATSYLNHMAFDEAGDRVFITSSAGTIVIYSVGDPGTAVGGGESFINGSTSAIAAAYSDADVFFGIYSTNFGYYHIPCVTCTATSVTVDTTSQNIASATLTKNDTPGTGTVTYQLSNNGGSNWETVTPSSLHTFSTTGSDLRFKITFTGNATVQDISISYNYYPTSGELVSNKFDAVDATNIVNQISWGEDASLPSGTSVVASMRTASSAVGLDTASWINFVNGQSASESATVSDTFDATTNKDTTNTTSLWDGSGGLARGDYSIDDLTAAITAAGGATNIMGLTYDDVNGIIYVFVWSGTNQFFKYDISTGVATNLTVSSGLDFETEYYGARGITFLNGKVYLSYVNGTKFAVYDPSTGIGTDLSALYPASTYINAIATDTTNGLIYMCDTNNSFWVYNSNTNTITDIADSSGFSALGAPWHSDNTYIYFDNSGGKLYFYYTYPYSGANLVVYDPIANTMTDISVSSGLSAFWGGLIYDLEETGGKIYIGGDGVAVYDPATGVATDLSGASGWSAGNINSLSASPDGQLIFAGRDNGWVSAYDVGAGTAADLAQLGSSWMSALLTVPENDKVYFTTGANKFVSLDILDPAYAVSTTIDSTAENILSATLTKNDTPGTGTVAYYLSNNGGTNWETVVPGVLHVFSTTGSDLRFKIAITGNATVEDISIDYYTPVSGSSACSKVSTTVTCGSSSVPSSFQDGSGDQFFQYKITLVSTGTGTPTVTSVGVQFVVNAPPEVQNVTATQNADGTVTISYEVRDPDTSTGSPGNAGYITPSFEYWNGSTYQSITTLAAGDTDQKAVNSDGVTWTAYEATWTAKTDYAGQYQNNTAKIRVTANDGEGANPTGTAESGTYTLDTKNPASSSITVDASTTPATVHLSSTDDSTLTMQVSSTDPTLASTSPEAYSATKAMTLAEGDTVYAKFTDAYSNASAIISATVPETPSAFIVQDTSNMIATPNIFRLFLAWKAVSGSFASYRIYRSTTSANPESWSELASVTNQATNYYLDDNLNLNDSFYYYVKTIDTSGNVSVISTIVHGIADAAVSGTEGGGGTAPAPVISNVSSGTPKATEATITWDTDTLSNSVVSYSTSPSTFTTSVSSPSYADNASSLGTHSVILPDLTPETTYYYRVSSTDTNGQTTTADNGGTGYTFSTSAGPVISAIVVSEVASTTAQITWTTDISSTSQVVYSINSDLTSSSTASGTNDPTTAHVVDLTGLTSGETYFFYVKSVDASLNETTDKRTVDGVPQYYSLTTIVDVTGPVISSVSAPTVNDTSAVITWTTDEPATSQVEYGLSDYATQTTATTEYVLSHSVTLTGLTKETAYQYRVVSADASANSTTDDNSGSGYTLTTSAEPGQVIRARTPETDTTPPTISNLTVTNIGSESAQVNWVTNEYAGSVVQYGTTASYGTIAGSMTDRTVSHQVALAGLTPGTVYHFVAVSVDNSGNQGISAEHKFATLNEDGTEVPIPEETTPTEETQPTEPDEVPVTEPEPEPETISPAQKIISVLNDVLKNPELPNVPEDIFISTVNEIVNRVVRPPTIVGIAPRVDVTGTTARISWSTDKKSSSVIAYAVDSEYRPNSNEPYAALAATPDEFSTIHSVELVNLQPSTQYHFQVRSKGLIGGEAQSTDATFQTSSELPEISDISISEVKDTSATLGWSTNIPTSTEVKFKNLATDTELTQGDTAYLREHEFALKNLQAGVPYAVSIVAEDEFGNKTTSRTINIATSIDTTVPEISKVSSDSTLYPGKESRVQTIITWATDEPATTRVIYQEGLGKDAETVELPVNPALVVSHTVVITKFRPATVYKFHVESTDASGNTSVSNDFLVLTPQQKASVLDVIINNFEQVFGWTKRLK